MVYKFKGQNLIARPLHFVLSDIVRAQVRHPLLCIRAVLVIILLGRGDVFNTGDNGKRAVANDAQPVGENAEECLAGLIRPSYNNLRQHIVNLKYDLAILLCLLHLAHFNGVGQQDERAELILFGVARIFEQSNGVGEKV